MSDDPHSGPHPEVERSWRMWFTMRARQLSLAAVLVVIMIVLLLTGQGDNLSPR